MLVFAIHCVNGQPGTNQCIDLNPGSKSVASAAGLARGQVPGGTRATSSAHRRHSPDHRGPLSAAAAPDARMNMVWGDLADSLWAGAVLLRDLQSPPRCTLRN